MPDSMPVQVKPISHESIPRALEKAERYRLLNEPFLAESICLDILACEPNHPGALITYVLAMADQLGSATARSAQRLRAAIERLPGEFDRAYYSGIVSERTAIAALEHPGFGGRDKAWHCIQDAMKLYEKADALQTDSANDDAVLRYNTCVRLIESHGLTKPPADTHEHPLE